MMRKWNTSDVSQVYSELSKNWDSKSKLIKFKNGTTNRLKNVLQEVRFLGRKRLLDFGSGTGKVCRDLVSSGSLELERVALVDVSREMCALAEENVSDESNVIVINGDESSKQIWNFAPYNLITMMQVLHHLPRPRETLVRLKQYASGDAALVALSPGPLYQSNIFPYKNNNQIDLLGRRSIAEWETIITSSGWRVETIYDDRFIMEFKSRKDYLCFIRRIGIMSRISGYKVGAKGDGVVFSHSGIDRVFVCGQYLTFYCRPDSGGGYVE